MRASERRLLFIFWDLSVYHWNYTCRKANGWLTSVQKTGWNPHLLISQTCSTERNNFNLFPSCFDTRRNLGVVWPKGLRTVRRKGTTSELVFLSCLLDWHECYPDVLWSRCRHLPIPKKYIYADLFYHATDIQFPVLRDVAERGRDIEGCIKQWFAFVKPNFERYVEPQRKVAGKLWAPELLGILNWIMLDIIVPRGVENRVAISESR